MCTSCSPITKVRSSRCVSILPDLFREGQGVLVQGMLGADGVFRADQVLAKHDENYMPPEVAEALEKAGYSPADYRQAPEAAETR